MRTSSAFNLVKEPSNLQKQAGTERRAHRTANYNRSCQTHYDVQRAILIMRTPYSRVGNTYEW